MAGGREDLTGEVASLDRELGEIELLVRQARTETERHEQRRVQAEHRLAEAEARAVPAELHEAVQALLTATRRAAHMEAQVDVLVGKQRALTRFRDRLRELAARYPAGLAPGAPVPAAEDAAEVPERRRAAGLDEDAVARAVLGAQEALRRDLARAVHDGPAQSLTNIALQAQIVERLIQRDPSRVAAEIGQLVAMVQQTLEATKAFIFDVRPMVLDDLGLVPTLRRSARDRGARQGVPIDFDSAGTDRRLPDELESALFRLIDDTTVGFLTTTPQRLEVRLDWAADRLTATVAAVRAAEPAGPAVPAAGAPERRAEELPPALAAMIKAQEVRAEVRQAARASAAERALALPEGVWAALQQRARSIDASVELADDGRLVRVVVALPRTGIPRPARDDTDSARSAE